jgi:hypothetical protein
MQNQNFNNPQNSGNPNFGGGNSLVPVPNATVVMVLGIVSLVLCGLIGIVCSIVAIVLGKKGEEAYNLNPAMYDQASYKNLKTGKICANIGLVLGILALIFSVIWLVFVFSTINRHSSFRF